MFAHLVALAFLLHSPLMEARIFPSTQTAWCLPGYQQVPTDPVTLAIYNSTNAIINWEITHGKY